MLGAACAKQIRVSLIMSSAITSHPRWPHPQKECPTCEPFQHLRRLPQFLVLPTSPDAFQRLHAPVPITPSPVLTLPPSPLIRVHQEILQLFQFHHRRLRPRVPAKVLHALSWRPFGESYSRPVRSMLRHSLALRSVPGHLRSSDPIHDRQ